MADIFSKSKRSEIMSRVRSENTKPELIVRSFLHRIGFRFRLHVRELPGNPDIVLPRHKKVIFVHGCFWHRHKGCKKTTTPKSHKAFWENKFEYNVNRDARNRSRLRRLGWKVLIVWECELRDESKMSEKIVKFMSQPS